MQQKGIRRHGDLKVDFVRAQVHRNGERLDLSDLTARLFFVLADNSPEPVSATELSALVWDGAFVSDETIAQRVKLLRQALGDSARSPRYIETIRGQGYRLVPPLEADGKGYRKPAAIALVALVVAALAGAVFFLPSRSTPRGALPPAGEAELPVMLAQAQRYLSGHRPDGVDAAIGLYRKALERWPENTDARVGLSFALSTRATKITGRTEDVLEAEALARAAIADASAEATEGDAWHALAYALDGQGRVDDALSAYLRAYELAPGERSAASSAAYLLAIRGRYYDALKLEVAVLGGRGQSRYADLQIAAALDLLGYSDVAARWFEKALMLNPGEMVVTEGAILSALRRGDIARAEQLYGTLPKDAYETPRGAHVRGYILLARGEIEAAAAAFGGGYLRAASLAMLGQKGDAPPVLPETGVTWPGQYFEEACALAARGEMANALTALGQAVDLGWRDSGQIAFMPFFDSLRGTPAFEAVLTRISKDIGFQRELVQSDDALRHALGLDGETGAATGAEGARR